MLSFTIDSTKIENRRKISDRRSGIDRRVANQKLTGLDMERGIARFDGDEVAWYDILRTYVSTVRPLLLTIEDIGVERLAEYSIIIHNIKGASHGIFAEMLGESGEMLENAAKNGDFNYVNMHNPTYVKAVWKLIGDIEEILLEYDSKNPKQLRDKPDAETLARLLEACKEYDMDGVDNVMTELTAYRYKSDDGLVVWLREKVDQMNFKEIIQRIG